MAKMEVHLLDVGAIEYGDCVLCLSSGQSILIDAGKKASSKPTVGRVKGRTVSHLPIQQQIEEILGGTTVDLLVVTHCHSDHLGNLPALLRDGELSCKYALIPDPQFSFGISTTGPEPGPPDSMGPAEKLWMALREEPLFSRDDAAVRQFIEDSAAEYAEYIGFYRHLRQNLGAKCVVYRGPSEQDSPGFDALIAEFETSGLKVFGPSQLQLGNCGAFLAGRDGDIADLQAGLDSSGRVELVQAYRDALRSSLSADAEDAGTNGNAVNCQSLVLSVGSGAGRALLTGDMQFTRPQLDNDFIKEEMKALKDAISSDVEEQGPFGFFKLSHHGATNGQDLTLMRDWGGKLFGISTGTGSSKHPTASILTALKKLATEESGVKWARTDMNGNVVFTADGETLTLSKDRGRYNDLTTPEARSGDAGPEEGEGVTVETTPPKPEVRVETAAGGNVEVLVRLPYAKTRVTVTIEIEPGGNTGGTRSPL